MKLQMKNTIFMGLIIGAFVNIMVASSVIPAAVYAIHNGVGHSDKASVGECYRATDDKDFCQDNKDSWKDFRESNQGPPNGGAADGDPASDVAGPANPDFD
jgi:hypothetical protein